MNKVRTIEDTSLGIMANTLLNCISFRDEPKAARLMLREFVYRLALDLEKENVPECKAAVDNFRTKLEEDMELNCYRISSLLLIDLEEFYKDDVVFEGLTPDQKERVQTFLEEFFQQKAREE